MTRFLGTETEYGISTPTDPHTSPILSSTHAVVALAAIQTGARSRWDYTEEYPLRDVRGFDLRRYHTVPVVAADAVGVANIVLQNGARYYVDHAHPEYSAPECSNAWEALIYNLAGDRIANHSREILDELAQQQISVLKGHPPCPPIKVYKNNVDGKGASYGSHENYLCKRDIEFQVLAQGLIPFFVARQIITGAGRVGIGEKGETEGFQISQRADYFFQDISLETTLNRGIINTRDEPHADATQYRRLHIIVGDANMSHTANFLKTGMTSLVLDALEAGVDFSDLQLVDAVGELKNISRDLSLRHKAQLKDGRRLSALEILAEYQQRLNPQTAVDHQVFKLWGEITEKLSNDPLETADLLDWTAKWALIKQYMARGLTLGDAKLKLIDLQYSDIDPARSLYHALVKKGRMQTLVDEQTIDKATHTPPEDSRAWLRGALTTAFAPYLVAASWQTVVLGWDKYLLRINMPEVGRLGKADVAALIKAADGDVSRFATSLQPLIAAGAVQVEKTNN
ncbi:depupylase/deamidase Dop [Corynebacterium caspium]|uniref:depupylase/deamidase Dop n=1 Tax=Corynebacterium caspium TaxID=234828 RepID=UPI00037BF4A4|nr:depupylase/deamidase Dop [Corynebacterium caspium]WKD59300.1 Pup deamidase/depupylase [Corynebacterium caspium DSM 44850]